MSTASCEFASPPSSRIIRLVGRVRTPSPTPTPTATETATPTATAVYARDRLPSGVVLEGPALIEEAGTTTVVPHGFRAGVDAHANLILERGAR